MINRNLWTAEEDKVLKQTVKETIQSGFGVKHGVERASVKLSRSSGACYQRFLYQRGETYNQKEAKAKKKIKAKLKERGVRIHGNKVYITPFEGMQVVFTS